MTAEPWPTCTANATIFDQTLTCVLPKDHEMDGNEMHRGEDGVQWSLAFHYESGRVTKL